MVARLVLDIPTLYARWLERQIQWRAGMALLAFESVLQQWRPGHDEHRLAELTDRAFAVVAPALDAPAGPPGAGRAVRPAQDT